MSAAKHLVLVAAAFVGAAALLVTTSHGIGIYSDSIVYIVTARSLLSGNGWTFYGAPVTIWPPLYPFLLAVPGFIGVDVIDGARWIQAIVWACNIFWIGLLTLRFSRGSLYAVGVASCVTLGSVDMLTYHAVALSDGAFLCFALPSLLAFNRYLDQGTRQHLVLAAVFIAIASLIRYIGLFWILGGCFALIVLSRKPVQKRIKDAFLFGIISIIPSIVWMLRNTQYETVTGRVFDLHWFLGKREFQSLLHTLSAWFFQWALPDSLWMILPVVALALWWLRWIRSRRSCRDEIDGRYLFTTFIAFHLGGIFLTAALSQAELLMDSVRLMIPIHALFIILIVTSVSRWYGAYRSRTDRIKGRIAVVCICAFMIGTGIIHINRLRPDGQGYASKAYRQSGLIARIRSIQPDVSIYSNLVPPINLYAGRTSNLLPQKITISTQRSNEQYESEMRQMTDDIRDSSAVLAYFDKGDSWIIVPTLEEIQKLTPLRCIAWETDGALYEALPDTSVQRSDE